MDGDFILFIIVIVLVSVGVTLLLSAVVLWSLGVLFGVGWSWKALLAVWAILVVIGIVIGGTS